MNTFRPLSFKPTRRWVAVLFAATVTACGGGGDDAVVAPPVAVDPGPVPAPGPSPTPAPGPGPAPAPTPAPGPSPAPAPAPSGDRVSRISYDYDNNGVVDATAEVTYNAAGLPIQDRYVYTGDGTADVLDLRGNVSGVFTSTYDSAGRLLTEDDSWADGTSSREALTYDAAGVLTRMDLTSTSGGIVTKQYVLYTYSGGRLQSSAYYAEDGTAQSQQDLTYGADGLPSALRIYYPPNPAAFNMRQTFSWNADGTIATKRVDTNSDGVFEESWAFAYSAGRLMSTVKTTGGRYAAQPGRTHTFTYDAAGHITRIDTDEGSNGSINGVETPTWETAVCSAFTVPLLLPLVTENGLFSSATGLVRGCRP